MGKCKTWACRAACCHNICLPIGMLEKFADKIVTPVIRRMNMPLSRNIPEPSEFVVTSNNLNNNRCPFLRDDYKCNIYDDRPTICRKFGEGGHPLLICKFRKQ